MKYILKHALFSLGIFVAAESTFLNSALAAGSAIAGDATAGATKAPLCGACHGADGNSMVPNFPKLAGQNEKYLLKQMKDIQAWDKEADPVKKLTAGRAIIEMTGLLVAMADQDLADIAAYYASQNTQLSGSQEIEVQINSGIKVNGLELGAKLYRAGNLANGIPSCTGCHSPDGKGNSAAGYPRVSGQHADYIEKQLTNFRAGNRTNDAAMTMRSIAEKLSDAEIKAVSNFIAGLH